MQLIRGCETECDITMPQPHSTTGTFTLLFAQPNRPKLPVSVCLSSHYACDRMPRKRMSGIAGKPFRALRQLGVKTLLSEIDETRSSERAHGAA